MLELTETEYRKWHRDLLEILRKKYQISIGVGQKLVNMTIKYLFCLELGYRKRLFDNLNFTQCGFDVDIPIDSYVLDWAKNNSALDTEYNYLFKKNYCWNKISSYGDYLELQKIIKGKLRESIGKGQKNIFGYETLVWNNLKKRAKR